MLNGDLTAVTEVFPPNFRELPPPKLELFDLDEMFSSQEVRLAQLANKCEETDLEFYIREAGEILGVSSSLPTNERNPKRILEHVLVQLFEFKKLGQDHDVADAILYDVGAADDLAGDEEMFSDIEDYDDLQ
ncbi:unnamed protein product [Heligmosomoides polygyrus]|uniref:Intraflagellar transport protein 52 homolog n=1 Tax=Heligmosomoides polygyrus TaxID=6339 RepID=A0A183GR52_HELPZ|nr:unnamed protein product [Heligmosomoides polygyrus]